MKKNKGFTLVELLAVIVLLGVLVTLVITQGTDVFHATKNQISKINEKNLKEAANTLANIIITCELDDNIYKELEDQEATDTKENCSSLKEKLFDKDIGIKVNIDSLKKLDLFEDVSNLCQGTMTITADKNSYKVTANMENITCK
jgi:prepilin-type N-terminal cleavage/methylation domain-containing protein